jgi:predicted NBD/HSP70 family sugar kinase
VASPESVRRHNLSLLLRHLHHSGALSRSEIGSTLGLTRSTIGELVADLGARGLVLAGDPARLGSPGRPSMVVSPNPGGAAAITAEIEVNSLAVAVVGLGGRILRLARVVHQPRRLACEQTVEDVAALIQSAQASIPAHCWIAGLGIAVAGVVRRADGLVHFAPNLGWRDVPLGRLVANRLGPSLPVQIANEADLGAVAEHTWGAGIGVDHLIYLSSAVGVGGGLVIDGRPLVGAAGCAGEVGHVQVNPTGARCRCGGVGCWETEIGGPTLLRRAGSAKRGLTSQRMSLGCCERRPLAIRWLSPAVEETGRWLGAGLSGLVNTFNPQRVVLGRYLGNMWPLVEQIVQAELRMRVMAPALDVVKIKPAQLGAEASLLGAAELVLTRVLDEPTLVPSCAAARRWA